MNLKLGEKPSLQMEVPFSEAASWVSDSVDLKDLLDAPPPPPFSGSCKLQTRQPWRPNLSSSTLQDHQARKECGGEHIGPWRMAHISSIEAATSGSAIKQPAGLSKPGKGCFTQGHSTPGLQVIAKRAEGPTHEYGNKGRDFQNL